jgi:erythronate-4-phosphate dehydrogenase
VGSRVQKLLRTLGVETVANDPPLTEAGVSGLVSQAQALDCDIVCLHVPLTREGPYPTLGMIGPDQLEQMPRGALLVNTARGNVVDGPALLAGVESGRIHAALDCWPGEPDLDPRLVQRATVATPHVAGYSDDGKRNGTWMVYQAFRDWAGLPPADRQESGQQRLELDVSRADCPLTAALEAACFVPRHDAEMRALAGSDSDTLAAGFDRLRKQYPFRRDFHGWDVDCPDRASTALLATLGFAARVR